MTKQASKRILSVTIKRMIDTDPDTSWMGEYATKASSEFSIDRAHSEECQTNDPQAKDAIAKLDRVVEYLVHQSQYASKAEDRDLYEDCDESADLLIEKQDELRECDCGERGDMERGQYRYFNPSSNYVDSLDRLVDGNTAEEVRKYVRQDYERMESLNRGAWSFIGIAAEAEVQTNGMSTIQRIRSGGLWGIESDSDRDHFRMVEAEELDQLKTELHAIGFTKRAISAAFRNVEHKDE